MTFDLHCHPGGFVWKGNPSYDGDEAVVKTVAEMNSVKLTGAFFAIVADAILLKGGSDGLKSIRIYESGEAWKEYRRQIKGILELLEVIPGIIALSVDDLTIAQEQGKVAVFISSEGGDFLEGHADRLDEMYSDGVRSLQLVHYNQNELGDSQTSKPFYNGLSACGKEVIRKMNKLKMLIDVAHASERTVQDIVDITDSPVILSHTILSNDTELLKVKRAISVQHAKLIMQTKGLIGAWPSGYNSSFDAFIDNVKRLVDAVGIDHVGLGTDMDGNFKPVFNNYNQMPQFIGELKHKGFTVEEAMKIAGGNAKRVLKVLG